MTKLKRASAREQIKNAILKGIHDGKYPPGFQLKEKILAETFGTSQAPVREALRELEGLQYVETIPYKGSIVKEVTTKDLLTAYKLRKVFEQMAVEEICEKGNIDLSELGRIAMLVDDAAEKGDKELYSKYNSEFHEFFINEANITMLSRMWNLVTFPAQIETALDKISGSLKEFSREHFDIIEALREKNCQRACELLGTHIENIRIKIQE